MVGGRGPSIERAPILLDQTGTPIEPPRVGKRFTGLSIADLGTAVSIVGGVAGLVYIVGGAVLGARLRLYILPTEAVVVQIPQWALLAVGLEEVVLPTVIVVGTFALWRLILTGVLALVRKYTNHVIGGWVGLCLEPLIVAWVAYFIFTKTRDSNFTGGEGISGVSYGLDQLALPAAATLMAVVAIVAAFQYVKSFSNWADIKKMIGIVTVLTFVLWTVLASTLPLLDVKVCRKGAAGSTEVTGWLVATSSDRIYIGEADVHNARYVESVPLSDATDVFISGNAKYAPCPA